MYTVTSSHDQTRVQKDEPQKTKVSLNVDVLHHIFETNCNPFQNSCALRDLRSYSQVCQQWRDIALESPSLWGRLIDIDELKWINSPYWAEEVVRRAGTDCCLWVTGSFIKRQIAAKWYKLADGTNYMKRISKPHFLSDFFFQFATRNWSRIERFVVEIGPNFSDPHRWSALCSLPSPKLREFAITGSVNNIKDGMKNTQLFSNHAPQLSIFVDRKSEFDIRNASWLSNIRHLFLGTIESAHDLLSTLQSIPLLEDLEVAIRSGRRYQPLDSAIGTPIALTEPVVLKAAKQVNMKADFRDCIDILASLELARGCRLEVSSWFVREASTLEVFVNALVNISRIFSPIHQSLQLEATMKIPFGLGSEIQIGRATSQIYPCGCSLRVLTQNNLLMFSISGSSWQIERALPVPFLNVIDVSHLKLDISMSSPNQDKENGRFPYEKMSSNYTQSLPAFTLGSILCVASSAKSLHTTTAGIFHLLILQTLREAHNPFLPCLTTLRTPVQHEDDAKHLLAFLSMRRRADRTITLLDLTETALEVKEGQILPDLIQALNDFTGMKVLWCRVGVAFIREHVCGIA